jgi:hypothetical protein
LNRARVSTLRSAAAAILSGTGLFGA